MMNVLEKLSKRKWSDNDVFNYIGDYHKTFFGYSSNNILRINAASGGCTTQILVTALQENKIQGALVCKTITQNNKVRANVYIATSKDEIIEAQGSTYVLSDYMQKAIPLIKNFNGILGVVGLPCEITALKRYISQKNELQNKVLFYISLFCGHASDEELIDSVLEKLLRKTPSTLKRFKFRQGHWRGKLIIEFENGTVITKSSFFYNQYQNLFFHCSYKCFSCYDHFGYDADINMGDVWLAEMKKNPIKHNAIIAKTKIGLEIIYHLQKEHKIVVYEVPSKKILDAQSRSVILHYNVSSRHKMGKRFSLKIPCRTIQKAKWHQNLMAWLIMFNWKWSKSRKAYYIFKIPNPIIKLYLYFIKFLQML